MFNSNSNVQYKNFIFIVFMQVVFSFIMLLQETLLFFMRDMKTETLFCANSKVIKLVHKIFCIRFKTKCYKFFLNCAN